MTSHPLPGTGNACVALRQPAPPATPYRAPTAPRAAALPLTPPPRTVADLRHLARRLADEEALLHWCPTAPSAEHLEEELGYLAGTVDDLTGDLLWADPDAARRLVGYCLWILYEHGKLNPSPRTAPATPGTGKARQAPPAPAPTQPEART